jgi:hypothetical protein
LVVDIADLFAGVDVDQHDFHLMILQALARFWRAVWI